VVLQEASGDAVFDVPAFWTKTAEDPEAVAVLKLRQTYVVNCYYRITEGEHWSIFR
jgi:hypothetical protein